ncbi:MAG: Hsp70 family protein [Pseudomonadota bacterium]
MKVGIGVDFGTSNSVAGVFDGEQVTLIELESGAPILPSATYIDQELKSATGQSAIDRYITDNSGRKVELIPEVIGEYSEFADSGGGEEISAVSTNTQKIYGAPLIDSGLQGRLFRGTKRLLGDEHVRRLMVFDQPFRLVALITPILLRMQKAIAASVGNFSNVHLGHPVNFEGKDEHRNALALSRLSEAYRYAGFKEQSFYPEPIAATVSYLHANQAVQDSNVLAVDFGGGTLDLCVLKRNTKHDDGQGFSVIATHGVGLGGDHIDQLLFRNLLFPLLGEGEQWRRRGFDREIVTRFPFDDYADLILNWAITYTLNQNKYTAAVLDCVEQGGVAGKKFERLRDLIQYNMSYYLFECVRQMKVKLSTQTQARLDIPEIDVDLLVSREQFEDIISPVAQAVTQAVDRVIAKAGLAGDDIDIVLRTGGSGMIPLVRDGLEERFPGKVVEHDPFTSVAAGLAIANYHGLTFR